MKVKMKMRRRQIVSPSSSTHSALPLITKKTHHYPDDDDDDFYSNVQRRFSSASHSKTGRIVEKKALLGSTKNKEKGSSKVWNKVSLSADAHPLSLTSSLPDDFALLSDGFRSPSLQDMKSSKIFAKKKHQRFPSGSTVFYSPKSLHNSIAPSEYERSSIGVDGNECHVLPPVLEETSFLQRQGISATDVSALRGGFDKATPVIDEDVEEEYRMNRRPKPFKEFLEEVDSIKQRAEVDPLRKQLLRKLREKEADIDDWESKQRSNIENKLDRIERKLEKKRAKAVQRTHQKLAKTSMEAEKRKAKARRSILKEMTRLTQQFRMN